VCLPCEKVIFERVSRTCFPSWDRSPSPSVVSWISILFRQDHTPLWSTGPHASAAIAFRPVFLTRLARFPGRTSPSISAPRRECCSISLLRVSTFEERLTHPWPWSNHVVAIAHSPPVFLLALPLLVSCTARNIVRVRPVQSRSICPIPSSPFFPEALSS